MSAAPVKVTLLTRLSCSYCEHAKAVLARVNDDFDLTINEIDLESDEGRTLATLHGVMFAPGVLIEGRAFGYGRLSERKLRKELAR